MPRICLSHLSLLGVVAVCCYSILLAPRAEGARLTPYVVSASARSIQIGTYFVRRDPTLVGAMRAFGQPAACQLQGRPDSTAWWPAIGVKMTFYTLGGFRRESDNACNAPDSVYLGEASMSGKRWRTARGLRIGDRVSRLVRLYPGAEQHENGWWLTIKTCYIPETSPCPNLVAQTAGGRVVRFVVPVGAGGD